MAQLAEYTETVRNKTVIILKNNRAMFPKDIVQELNQKAVLEEKLTLLKLFVEENGCSSELLKILND